MVRSVVWLTLCFGLFGCGRGFLLVDDAAVVVSAKLPMQSAQLDGEIKDTLRVTLEIPGLLGESSLDLNGDTAEGAFVVDIAEMAKVKAVLRVYGGIHVLRPVTLLAVYRKSISVGPGEELSIAVKAKDFNSEVDDATVLDANRNGSTNLSDLLGRPEVGAADGRPCDPAVPETAVGLSTTDLQFPSGLAAGEYARQVVVVENYSDGDITYSAAIIDAPGVSVGRIALSETSLDRALPSHPEVLALPESVLHQGEIALLSVAYSPASHYLSTGVLQIQARDRCDIAAAGTVRLIANVGVGLQPADPDYQGATLVDIPELASYGDPELMGAEILYSGQPIQVAVAAQTEQPEQTVAGYPADAVYLVNVPAQHSLSVIASNLSADVDLAVIELNADHTFSDNRWLSQNAGLSVEATHTSFVEQRQVVIIVGRNAGQAGARAADADAPFSLSAHLVGAPRFTELPEPSSDEVFGGATVVLGGENFSDQVEVRFGDALATDVAVSDQGRTITCRAPEGELDFGRNPATITAKNLDTQFVATLPQAFLYLPGAPSVISVSPRVISTAAVTPVVITGSNFANRFGTPRVLFGQETATSVHFVSATRLEVLAPLSATPGPVSVTVQNMRPHDTFVEGRLDAAVTYQAPASPAPTLTAAEPSQGDVRGGTSVTLTGTNFVDGALVYFGGNASGFVSFVSATQLHATTPPGVEVGTVNVVVINPDAQSSDSLPFAYTAALAGDPVLLGISPLSIHAGVPGDALTLLGESLGPSPYPSSAAIFASDGVTHYTASLATVGSSIIGVTVGQGLPAAAGYVVQLTYPGGVTTTSPAFSAVAPQIYLVDVISGAAQEGSNFVLAITGHMFHPEHLLSVVLDNGTAAVELQPVLKTENLLQLQISAGVLLQGNYSMALRYSNGYVASSTVAIAVAGDCNNGIKNAGEECDTLDFGDADCVSRGFLGGQLLCTQSCTFDTSSCNNCGNGQRDDGEQCDQADLNGSDCSALGFDDGVLSCSDSCTFDATACTDCGNGILEPSHELCDDQQLGDATCVSLNFTGGQLACSEQCAYDTSDCFNCGDGFCGLAEDNSSCAQDCPVTCGDGSCLGGETCRTCPADCSLCAPFHAQVTGGDQTAVITKLLSEEVVVAITDAEDTPVSGVTVEITPPVGGWVTYEPTNATTTVQGIVRVRVGLGVLPGVQTFTVNATAAEGTPIVELPLTLQATAVDVDPGDIFSLVNQDGGWRTSGIDPSGSSVRSVFTDPESLIYDSDDNLYIASSQTHYIYRVTPAGLLSLYAGNGSSGFAGDGLPATQASVSSPCCLDFDAQGQLYFSVTHGAESRIKRINTQGLMETYVGGGPSGGEFGEGDFRTLAFVGEPMGLTIDRQSQDLWYVDYDLLRIRRVDGATGIVTTVVDKQNPPPCSDGSGLMQLAWLTGGVLWDNGHLLFQANGPACCGTKQRVATRLWRLTPEGDVHYVTNGEGSSIQSSFNIAMDPGGQAYIAIPSENNVIVVDGLGRAVELASGTSGFSGDFGPSSQAMLSQPYSVALNSQGDLAIADRLNYAVRIIRSAAQVTPPTLSISAVSGDNQSRLIARPLLSPLVVSVEYNGQLAQGAIITFSRDQPGSVLEQTRVLVTGTGEASSYAWVGRQPGQYTFSVTAHDAFGNTTGEPFVLTATAISPQAGDVIVLANDLGVQAAAPAVLPWPAVKSEFAISSDIEPWVPMQTAVAPAGAYRQGTLYFPEIEHHRVIGVTPQGEAFVVAGTGELGLSGDGAPATQAQLHTPTGVAVDSAGNVYIADASNGLVRIVTADGNIDTFAGGGADDSVHGDGRAANAANLLYPVALAMGPSDELYIVEGNGPVGGTGRCRVRKVAAADQIISTVWENEVDECHNCYLASSYGVNFRDIHDVTVDAAGTVYIGANIDGPGGGTCGMTCVSDCISDSVFRLDGVGGAEGIAIGAQPSSVAAHNSDGSVLFADGHAIQRRQSDGTVSLVTGDPANAGFLPEDTVPAALLNSPMGLSFDSDGNLYFVDSQNRVRVLWLP